MNEASIEIVRYNKKDFDIFRFMRGQLLNYEHNLIPDELKADTSKKIENSLIKSNIDLKTKELKSGSDVFLAKYNDEYIGFISFRYFEESELLFPHIFIGSFFVNESYRHLGCGRMLLHKVEDLSKDKRCTAISLHCLSNNEASIDFYKKMGFEVGSIGFSKHIV